MENDKELARVTRELIQTTKELTELRNRITKVGASHTFDNRWLVRETMAPGEPGSIERHTKKEIARQIGEYLMESNLVTFTTEPDPERNHTRVTGHLYTIKPAKE